MENIKNYKKTASIVGIAVLGAVLTVVFAMVLTQGNSSDNQGGITYIPKHVLGLQTDSELPKAEATSTCGQD